MKANRIEFVGDNKLVLDIDQASAPEAVKAVNDLNGYQIEVKLKPFRAKRSLDANAYAWALMGKIAEKLGCTSLDVYKTYIRDYGIYKDFLLVETEADTFFHLWQMQGLGWVVEKLDFASDGERTIYRAYYGSSVYNSRQMARLIDAIVRDCKDNGIETLPPGEIERLVKQCER